MTASYVRFTRGYGKVSNSVQALRGTAAGMGAVQDGAALSGGGWELEQGRRPSPHEVLEGDMPNAECLKAPIHGSPRSILLKAG